MSIILTGDGVSRGICIGQALIVHKDNIDYTPSFITKTQIKRETKKFSNALDKLKKEYQKSTNKITNNKAIIKLMNMQLSFLEDDTFRKNVVNKISNELHSVSWSISSEYNSMKKSFNDIYCQ